jgi:hypothetical protein
MVSNITDAKTMMKNQQTVMVTVCQGKFLPVKVQVAHWHCMLRLRILSRDRIIIRYQPILSAYTHFTMANLHKSEMHRSEEKSSKQSPKNWVNEDIAGLKDGINHDEVKLVKLGGVCGKLLFFFH